MVSDSLMDNAQMGSLAHLVTKAFPEAMCAEAIPSVQMIRAYVASILKMIDRNPTEHPPSRATWHLQGWWRDLGPNPGIVKDRPAKAP